MANALRKNNLLLSKNICKHLVIILLMVVFMGKPKIKGRIWLNTRL